MFATLKQYKDSSESINFLQHLTWVLMTKSVFVYGLNIKFDLDSININLYCKL